MLKPTLAFYITYILHSIVHPAKHTLPKSEIGFSPVNLQTYPDKIESKPTVVFLTSF